MQHRDPAAFYLPTAVVNPFGNESSVQYDAYHLLPVSSRASGTAPYDVLVTQVDNDYRLLGPVRITDPNGNSAKARYDALGRVTATWTRGKDGEGDPEQLPGAEFVYHTASVPTWSQGSRRERHGDAGSPWQRARAYSDGSGRVVMTKSKVEPGQDGQLRWVGTGRAVYDNKGMPVKQYEPYFSGTDAYEDEPDIVQQGVTAVLHYDSVSRLVRTDYPDGTFTRVVINPWQTETWDANDTVKDSRWYAERGSPDPATEAEPADPDRRAAWLAARDAGTPAVSRMDSFGRAVRGIADAGPDGPLETVTELDIEGSVLSVTDPRGIVVRASQYDLAGRAVVQHSPDAGTRWTLPDVVGVPIRVWDDRGYTHEFVLDALRRATRTWVNDPADQRRLVHATWFGEDHPAGLARNLLGRPVITLDGSGLTHAVEHDFQGNRLADRHAAPARDHQAGPGLRLRRPLPPVRQAAAPAPAARLGPRAAGGRHRAGQRWRGVHLLCSAGVPVRPDRPGRHRLPGQGPGLRNRWGVRGLQLGAVLPRAADRGHPPVPQRPVRRGAALVPLRVRSHHRLRGAGAAAVLAGQEVPDHRRGDDRGHSRQPRHRRRPRTAPAHHQLHQALARRAV